MTARHPFLEALISGVVLGDGATGTALFSRGAPLKGNIELLNITDPELVENLHRDYIKAGSRVIETNTFGANRLNLNRYLVADKLQEIIEAGVTLARKAAGNAWVAGSVGPLPPVDGEPVGKRERLVLFEEIITGLLDNGVDLLMFETFTDYDQLADAVRLARSMTDAPIVAQMAFEPGGRLPGGIDMRFFADSALDAGADVIGANCGAGVPAVRDAVRRLVGYNVPVSAFMNAGFAERIEDRTLFVAPADYLASTAVELSSIGVRFIGGCCGTSPDTIRAIGKALNQLSGPAAEPSATVSVAAAPRPEAAAAVPPVVPHGILVELDPPKTLDVSPLVRAASALKEAGASAITLADNPLASVRVDTLAVAGIIMRESGIRVIPHLTGRDRNRIALQSFIMGAHVLDIKSLLCVTGDPVRMYNETNTSGVFDLTSIGLVKLVSEFNAGQRSGDGAATSFSIAVALNPNVRSIQSQIGKLERKIEAGAHFALTQPIFDPERLDALLEALDKSGIVFPVFAGVMPLMSSRNAEFLHNEVPGIYIPEKYRERMKRYEKPEDQKKAGIDIALELAHNAAGRVHGLYFMTPRNKADFVIPVMQSVIETHPHLMTVR